MKRFFFLIVLVMMVSWIMASHRAPSQRTAGSSRHGTGERRGRDGRAEQKARRALTEVTKSLDQAGDEVRQAIADVREEVHEAFHELRVALVSDDDSSRIMPAMPPMPPVPPLPPAATEEAEGLPVRIVTGSRVTGAKASPPAKRSAEGGSASDVSTESSSRTVTGRLSATKERALADARQTMRNDVAAWLEPEVSRTWTPSVRMFESMLVDEPRIKSVEKDYGEVFEAKLTFDASPRRRTALIEAYNRQLVEQRLVGLGAALAFVLICLAAVSGYIRADEATKGYYTNRLRMLAAAGVGASGVLLYHMVV